MIQHIFNNTNDEIVNESNVIREFFKDNFKIKNIIVYILSFMMSLIGGQDGSIFSQIAPFGLAMFAACVGSGVPIAIVAITTLAGYTIKSGVGGFTTILLTILVFLACILIKRPDEDEEKNEHLKVGMQITFSVFVVQLIKSLFKGILLYDILYNIMLSIVIYMLYKIFVNGLAVIQGYKEKEVFSLEEVMSAGMLLAIAINCFGNFSIFGYSVRNILSILIVLVLGWNNGMLVGATAGISIGTILGLLNGQEPIMLAAYGISGLVAGILNKFGKFGVILGFILGNIILSYLANGNKIEVIKFQEVLIAALGLLAVPKKYKINISDIVSEPKLLPETTTRTLEENKETVSKLETMSDTIKQIANEYNDVAASVVTDEEVEEQEKQNEELFTEELMNNLEDKEENLLYEEIYNNNENIINDIFEELIKNDVITRTSIIDIFKKHNNYILGFSREDKESNITAKNDIDEMLKVINYSYRISKINFVWKKKLDSNKKQVSNQLENVSEAISNLAMQITKDEIDEFAKEKEQMRKILKDINIKEIAISKEDDGKYQVNIYTGICSNEDGSECFIKKIDKALEKVFQEKMVLQKQKCGLRASIETCVFTYTSEDKFTSQIGIAKSKKYDSIISGDTTIQTKLDDGKMLIAISDGMGSGPEARKSSKIAIKMLERLLSSGFNKDTALKLINNTISANTDDDMYATLDVSILDLYNGSMEFIKNGACPTFVKRDGKVEILKSVALPTGILNNIDLIEYNYNLEDGDIVVMCSDGILDSNKEYASKELWVQEVLEDIETDDAQRIADILLCEARDNDFGKEKDDMTVIVFKVTKK